MKAIFTLVVSLFFSHIVIGQTDPAAFSLLDKFSNRATAAQSVTMNFNMTVEDALEGTSNEEQGSLVISGNKYKLTLPGSITWYDGEAIYTLAPEVEEVTITEPDPANSEFINSPSLLFTMYRDGYKLRLVGEADNGTMVDLYPEELNADFSRIRLVISSSYDLAMAEYRRKDGITITIIINEYSLKKSYKDDFFQFDKRRYNNVDIIDMRF